MLDVNNIPSQFSGDVRVFNRNAIWVKPNNCTMAYILTIGAGGGGGGGGVSISTSAGGGGGGGGAITNIIIPLSLLPDVLYLTVTVGGTGGVSGGSGNNSGFPTVTISGNATAPQDYIVSPGGGSGGGNTSGAAGSAGTVSTAASASFQHLGCFSAYAGVAGVAQNTNIIALASSPVSGGAGGGSQTVSGSVDNPGGNITGAGIYPTISGGAGSTVGNASPGGSALQYIFNNLISAGGSGGGGSVLGTGGAGGNGGIGCGGGGGGAGTVAGGNGGVGGPGMAIIACW